MRARGAVRFRDDACAKSRLAILARSVQKSPGDKIVQHLMRVRLVMSETCCRVLGRHVYFVDYPMHAFLHRFRQLVHMFHRQRRRVSAGIELGL